MTPLPDVLPIKPFTQPARGEVTLPGSKSITNRALLLAALCDGPVTLTGALFSEDTEIMAKALEKLGFKIDPQPDKNEIYIEGQDGKIPNQKAELFVGNAGTAARFLTALCAAAPRGTYKLDGIPQMRKRPMKGLLKALEDQGAKITYHGEKYFFPFTIEAHGLKGGEVEIDASESSQMLSALLMVAPLAERSLTIRLIDKVRWSFVDMTVNLMKRFSGPDITRTEDKQEIHVPNKGTYQLPAREFQIESDATAASYFIVLPIVTNGGLIGISDYHFYRRAQGDVCFAEILFQHKLITGLNITPPRPVHVIQKGANKVGLKADFSAFSDTFLTLAAIAPLLEGQTKITGIAHTRKQETDRVAGATRELKKLGQDVIEEEDSLTITSNLDELKKRAAQGMIEIETYNDHRFAMSFAILGCYDLLQNGQPWLSIKNPACCAKTFPDFFVVLEKLRQDSLTA